MVGTLHRRFAVLTFAGAVLLAVGLVAAAPAGAEEETEIFVPDDYSSIQEAIDAAADGDTIIVAVGTYGENIDFLDKEITLTSQEGPDSTIIDGGGDGSVVTMNLSPGRAPTLHGFTITNGNANASSLYVGGGVKISGGAPIVEGNVIHDNRFCSAGGGVHASFSAAVIRANDIFDNVQSGCVGGVGGGGVAVVGGGTVEISANAIFGNGRSGIALFAAGTPQVVGNSITGNDGGAPGAGTGQGGGIRLSNWSDALIENNVIAFNGARDGGGIYWLVPSGNRGPHVVNNTIGFNGADRGLAIFADGFDGDVLLANNSITAGSDFEAVLYCGTFNAQRPTLRYNNVWNAGPGPAYGGDCADATGSDGNISVLPEYAHGVEGDYHLQPGSPLIDAGSDGDAPDADLDGNPRPLDGDGNGSAVADIGAYEFIPTMVITGDTTLAADFTGTVNVEADGVTLDCAGHTVFGLPNENAIRVSGQTGVTVENCTVEGAASGILLENSADSELRSNTAVANHVGFRLVTSTSNVVRGNTADDNCGGFVLFGSSSNDITGNEVTESCEDSYGAFTLFAAEDGEHGVIIGSEHNVVSDNVAEGVTTAFAAEGADTNHFVGNTAVDARVGYVVSNASDNLFEENVATASDVDVTEVGFLIAEETHGNVMRSNTSIGPSNQSYTIVGGAHNVLDSNVSLGAYDTGFGLIEAPQNVLVNNRVDGYEPEGVPAPHVGFSIYFGSDGNTLQSNRTTGNNEAGFLIVESSSNLLERNVSRHVAAHGFVVDSGSGNEFLMNRALHNTLYGFLDHTEAEAAAGDAGTESFYVNNVCGGNGFGPSQPTGICPQGDHPGARATTGFQVWMLDEELLEIDAGDAFFVRHGWGLDSADMRPPASFWFDLEIDGVPVEGGRDVTQGGCSFGEDWCQLRVTTFNFADGLPARVDPYSFVGNWYSSCEWAEANIDDFEGPCDHPNTSVVAFSFGREVLVSES